MADHIRFSRTVILNKRKHAKENATDIFVDGERVGTICGRTKSLTPVAMNYTVWINGDAGFGALSLQDAKRRVRKLYEQS